MQAFLGSICQFGFNFAPYQWALCNGSVLPISQYAALFSLIGTNYGGNGTTNFQLPNLMGNVAIGQGSNGQSNYVMGETGGSNTVTILNTNLPAHSHTISLSLNANNTIAGANSPAAAFPGLAGTNTKPYNTASATGVFMANPSATLGATGGTTPISIADPSLVLNYCISLYGVFPTRN